MPETSTARRLLEFSRLFAAGETVAALELIDALVADHPNEGPMHWQRARTLERLERYPDARAAVKRVLELRREFAPAWVLRAELGEEEGDYDPEPDLRRAVELDPRLGRARYALALLMHDEDGKDDEARALMDLAIELDPNLHEAFAARGGWSRIDALTERPINRNHLERALADFDRAIAIKPLPSYRFAHADILQGLERYDEAIAELDGLLAELSEHHPLRALALDARGRCGQALAGRAQPKGLQPRDPQPQDPQPVDPQPEDPQLEDPQLEDPRPEHPPAEEDQPEQGKQHLIGRLAGMLNGLRQRK
jgi:tetratricopeptide (TPR) repeat protein